MAAYVIVAVVAYYLGNLVGRAAMRFWERPQAPAPITRQERSGASRSVRGKSGESTRERETLFAGTTR